MGSDHSFDIVCDIEAQEITNAVQQTQREVGQRYDLKDADAEIDYKQKENQVLLKAKDEYKVKAIDHSLKKLQKKA